MYIPYLSQSYLVPESTDLAVKESFNIYAARALNSAFIDNDYKNIVLSSKFDMGYKDEALKELEEIIRVDPRNIDTLLLLSRGNETLGNVEKAITKRFSAEFGFDAIYSFSMNSRVNAYEFKFSNQPKITKSIQEAINTLALEKVSIVVPGNMDYPLSDQVWVIGLEKLLEHQQ
jgi:hypothetical protein